MKTELQVYQIADCTMASMEALAPLPSDTSWEKTVYFDSINQNDYAPSSNEIVVMTFVFDIMKEQFFRKIDDDVELDELLEYFEKCGVCGITYSFFNGGFVAFTAIFKNAKALADFSLNHDTSYPRTMDRLRTY